ncbi:hypothetical protein [Dechloromonas sp. HYN0024]|uniref:hypothetical protein n=1 Tax=Dechloromonas sp. HYN0024 TaxID=2231055 RepID=UPI000E430329|nr:hypothetical protein [Dechloromonas sp. HYN0024]AXS78817.1 hypothetical protein HYN24_01475 [Dechloromonas sp. HYN0024]
MADIPEHELEETRAALAPTLEATAAILPWVRTPRKARFDPKLNTRWIAASRHLATAWSERHAADNVRPAIFSLYAIAIETADADCLRLGEALACAADRLEETSPTPRLIAAITACIECLDDAAGLEHTAFGERASHFAKRLEACATATTSDERSAILDQLFVNEASEQIQLMRDALAALPPDAYALSVEARKLTDQAELLELWGVMHLARHLTGLIGQQAGNLEDGAVRASIEQRLGELGAALACIRG